MTANDPVPTPPWLRRARERAEQPPVAPRVPLHLHAGGPLVGSIESRTATRLLSAGLPLQPVTGGVLALAGDPDAALAAIAKWLREQRLCGRWRDELLAVTDVEGRTHAVVERAAVRPLGITTHAVHLVGLTADGRVWVQQRADDKATDPGLWDTLMGGLVAAGEVAAVAFERETWEEAGLRPEQLQATQPHGAVMIRRPVVEGYMVERIETYSAVLGDGVEPVNRDGEVQRFECIARTALASRLANRQFTLEAALVHVRVLGPL